MIREDNPLRITHYASRIDAMLYRLSTFMLSVLFRFTGGVTLIGQENIPKTGGVILAANHISYLDPPVVGCYLRRQLHYMAKEELFRSRVVGAWMRWVGTFPVRRGTPDRKALKHAIDLLGQGRIVCIFPEGTRSPDGKLQAPELGIGLIALRSGAPIVPAAIIGTDKVLPPHSTRLYRHRVKVVYGRPLTFPSLCQGKETRQSLEEVGQSTMSAISELISTHAS